ncbi:hypothetical protein NDU88_001661 [Pleurodeles waltl]|uniref:Uncharacterized protein n=1 Tax=Pleurodeles waltl TaxID=8319 RepID=A0AAV7LY94_PLEWA|nr:hypothetical protein NDU88_001661 [Pleurodeles waltl]
MSTGSQGLRVLWRVDWCGAAEHSSCADQVFPSYWHVYGSWEDRSIPLKAGPCAQQSCSFTPGFTEDVIWALVNGEEGDTVRSEGLFMESGGSENNAKVNKEIGGNENNAEVNEEIGRNEFSAKANKEGESDVSEGMCCVYIRTCSTAACAPWNASEKRTEKQLEKSLFP